jgi:hypothetical protein
MYIHVRKPIHWKQLQIIIPRMHFWEPFVLYEIPREVSKHPQLLRLRVLMKAFRTTTMDLILLASNSNRIPQDDITSSMSHLLDVCQNH